jgi:Domain of unknown function (DUF5615)
MSIKFLFDENLEDRLRLAVTRHNLRGIDLIDVVSIGDSPDLPRGIDDPDILIWAEREARILVSHDLSTLPNFLSDHLRDQRHSPGVFLIRRGFLRTRNHRCSRADLPCQRILGVGGSLPVHPVLNEEPRTGVTYDHYASSYSTAPV